MKMNLDDPNLTAYALGELSGPARAEMEKPSPNPPKRRLSCRKHGKSPRSWKPSSPPN